MAAMSEITIWRRHTSCCSHSDKGRAYLKCSCPIWADGYKDGKREFRKSLGTRDLARARKKAANLEGDGETASFPLKDAVDKFIAHCKSHGSQVSSARKYTTIIRLFEAYCLKAGIESVDEITMVTLDDYRASRNLAPVTMKNELRLLRYFFRFAVARKWCESNIAKEIPFPTVKPTEKTPYTKAEFEAIVAATRQIGHEDYERKRAAAMIMVFRYTALRISDVAMLTRDRIQWDEDGKRWRIFVRTGKRGNPIYLPVPEEMKDALDRVVSPGPRYYFWTEEGSVRTLVGIANRLMRSVFRKSKVQNAHAHRFRHTLATELLGFGATFDEVADVLGNSAEMVRKHYGQWSPLRQSRIDGLMEKVHESANYQPKKLLMVK